MPPLTGDDVLARLKDVPHGVPAFSGQEIAGLSFSGRVIQDPVDFSGAVFKDAVDFSMAEFRQPAGFKGAVFERGANFLGAVFHAETDFSWSRFTGQAYFWKTRFLEPVTFFQMVVGPSDKPSYGYLDPGETNFSWAYFRRTVNFYRASFGGSAYFWRTLFCRSVDFAEAQFKSSVVFAGNDTDVCIARRDFSGPRVFDRLLLTGVTRPDPEIDTGPHGPKFFADFHGIPSLKVLRSRLEKEGFNRDEAAEVEAVWKRYARPMFTGDDPISFRGATFHRPDEVRFNRVNLDRCLLTNSTVSSADFVDVTWDERPTLPMFRRRRAAYDERVAETPAACSSVRRLYFDLRKNFARKEDFDAAGDFYYGEMEMKRRMQPVWSRYTSFTALYKYFGGFGEQPATPFLWLVLFVFAAFPILYLLGGAEDDFVAAVLHSLEVATFLDAAERPAATLVMRFVEGLQRIIVPVQLGLFLVAIKRDFEQK